MGAGVSVGFDFSWFKNLTRYHPITFCDITSSIGYEDVIYDCERLEEKFANICYDAMKEYKDAAWLKIILPTFKHYAAFIKNPTFKDEKETRIVFYPYDKFINTLDGLSDLERNVRPYYSLSWENNDSCAMTSVTIGYKNKKGIDDINKLLLDYGITAPMKITKSECSYRERKK